MLGLLIQETRRSRLAGCPQGVLTLGEQDLVEESPLKGKVITM